MRRAVTKESLNQFMRELASPDDFIPRPADWREQSRHIATHGELEFYHYDFSMQALAKLERGHVQDLGDVAALLRGGYVSADELRRRFAQIEPALLRYPAIDPKNFRRKVEDFLAKAEKHDPDKS